VFQNPRDKTDIVHMAGQLYPENIYSFHKRYLGVCKVPHSYLFLDLTQSSNNLLKLRTKIFPDEITKVFTPVEGNEPFEMTTTLSSRS
jgi:hypothetical protein